jgi:H+/Cl- antiporter ClcA
MDQAWTYILTGIGFCLAGIFLFQRNAFEENKKIKLPLLVIVLGIILLSVGMAKKTGLMAYSPLKPDLSVLPVAIGFISRSAAAA